ncbi:MAG: hypothetical protein K0S19_1342 [Geminicoccaceae bacterium]|nr:hypothetical protein [Geminicoccaceae bacterium]
MSVDPTPSRIRIRRRGWLFLALVACVLGVVAMVGPTPSSEYVIDIGPISMPAKAGHGDLAQPSPLALELPVDGWLRGLSFDLVDEKGRQLPREMLHHLNLIVPDKRELFSQIMLRIGAAGPETQPYALPWFLGYRVRPGDSLLVTAMLHNPTPQEHQAVRLRVRLQLSPSVPLLRPLAIRPVYLARWWVCLPGTSCRSAYLYPPITAIVSPPSTTIQPERSWLTEAWAHSAASCCRHPGARGRASSAVIRCTGTTSG